jgi:hypothetical protein
MVFLVIIVCRVCLAKGSEYTAFLILQKKKYNRIAYD